MEQLNSGFLECDEIYYLKLNPMIIRNYRVIIFFKCPWTKKVNKAIQLAKILKKTVLFDINDLLFDNKYIETIPLNKSLRNKMKIKYDSRIERIGKTLKLCHGAITSTLAIARELKKYISNVFINHNVANEEMWKLSQEALINNRSIKDNNIIIGYFSGSITHNLDLELIKPALIKILKKFKNVKLLLVGKISYPKYLKEFYKEILVKSFIDWRKLPKLISNVDINISPIKNSLFNLAKSANMWVEASLVKIPTIASNFGQFKNVIKHNITGFLCSNNQEWFNTFETLIKDENLRKIIGENAYKECQQNYNTIYSGIRLSKYINNISSKHIGFFLPSLQIAEGIYVVLKHACILQDEGWDVELIFDKIDIDLI